MTDFYTGVNGVISYTNRFSEHNIFYFYFILIQFNVPFKIISLIETSQSVGGAKREYPRKTT